VGVEVWTGLSWFGIETGGGHFECDSETLGSIKWGNFLTSCKLQGLCSIE
jgi:hypothetical protein